MLKIIAAIVGVLVVFFFVSPKVVFGAFSISSTPSSVAEDGSFSVTINLTISGSAGNNYYLRAAFSHQDTPTSYFGYTKDNSGSWYNGTPSPIDHTKFYQITMDSGNSWAGTIDVKPDTSSTVYKGAGNYNFKVGRYTAAGSGPTWSDNSVTIAITATTTPTPSPTPSPSPTPTSTASPTPTPSPTSTATPRPTTTASPTPTPRPTNTPSPTPRGTTRVTAAPKSTPTPESMVLGITDISSPSGSATVEGEAKEGTKGIEKFLNLPGRQYLAGFLAILGLVFLVTSGFLFFKGRNSVKIDKTGDENN